MLVNMHGNMFVNMLVRKGLSIFVNRAIRINVKMYLNFVSGGVWKQCKFSKHQ
jgi:hypothetical protein